MNVETGPAPCADAAKVRRRLLGAAAGAVACAMAGVAHAAVFGPSLRTLHFLHTHTGESLSIPQQSGATLQPGVRERIEWFMRDFRTGDRHPIDPALIDQLSTLAAITGSAQPFQVISAYRSPATNQALRQRSGGVAAHSLHLEGRAIDIRLGDVALGELRDAALSMRAGGVGFYPGSQFVHIDTGGVRRW